MFHNSEKTKKAQKGKNQGHYNFYRAFLFFVKRIDYIDEYEFILVGILEIFIEDKKFFWLLFLKLKNLSWNYSKTTTH